MLIEEDEESQIMLLDDTHNVLVNTKVEEQQQSDSMEQMRNVYSDVNATNETVMKIEQRRFQSRVCPESPAGISGRNSHSWFNNSGSVFSGWVGGVVWCCGDGSQRVFGVSYYLQGISTWWHDKRKTRCMFRLDMVENQSTNALAAATSARDSPPMTLTYRLQLILAPDWYWGESQTGYMSASFCIQMVVAASVFTWIQVKPLQLTRLVHGRLVTKNLRHGLIHFLCDDTILSSKADGTGKRTGPSRAAIQIRETAGGGISLAGVTEAEVTSQEEI
ncbi:hypothetical protein LXL04_034892 [Taraxacum kok-saghyz]